MKRRTLLSIIIGIIILAAVTVAAYRLKSYENKPAVTPRPSASASPAESGTGTPSGATSSGSPAATANWSTVDVSIGSVLKSGTAQLVAIRTGAHPEDGYDRISIDFQGQAPGVKARYVDKVVQDGSGAEVSIPGGAYLQLTFSPAAAHNEAGNAVAGVPRSVQSTGYAGLKSYVINGNFEGVLSIALGQSSKAGFKVNRADHGGVSTIYIDVPRP